MESLRRTFGLASKEASCKMDLSFSGAGFMGKYGRWVEVDWSWKEEKAI